MIYLFGILFFIMIIVSPVFLCLVFHPFSFLFYGIGDIIKYIIFRKKNNCPTGELVAFCGLFGKGKTLSAVHRVIQIYKRKNGKKVWDRSRKKFVTQRIVVISNVALSIPYQEFISLEQVVAAAEYRKAYDLEHDTLTVTLVLGDEFSVQMNSRQFKNNLNPLLLNTILTCRHHYISFYYCSQRFAHVDALLRQVTSYVVDCEKVWRFEKNYRYDAWEMENATNVMLLKPYRRPVWFIRNKDFAAYDTLACVGNLTKSWKEGDMMTEEEILQLQQPGTATPDALVNPSKKLIKATKKKQKGLL